jgi:hypothetical protein
MSRNGSGVYSLPAGNPVVPSTTISTTWANTTLTDIASALTGSVASDGQTPMSASLNMANNKIISVLDPTNAQDAATKAYADAKTNGTTSGSFTTLSATGVATFSAGTAAAPAITTTGDTNTGMFFPAADIIAFTDGGTERMRIDSSGNVGIGTSSPSNKLSVVGGRTNLTANNETFSLGVQYGSATGLYYVGATNSATPDLVFSQVGGVERMRVTNDGGISFGSSGTAYGTSGQILTSAGNAPPTWQANQGAKAWVQYDTNTGTISGSFNVSSITLGSTGITTVNFTTAMPNTNYAFNLSSTGDGQVAVIYLNGTKASAMTTTTLRISTAYWTGTSFASSNVSALSVAIFSS